MMRALHLFTMLLGCYLLVACTTVGNGRMTTLNEASSAAVLVVGKTTKSDVVHELGEAKVRPYDSGHEIWLYEYSQGLPKFLDYVPVVGLVSSRIDTKRRELRILFDPQGVVKKYALIEVVAGR